MILLTGEEIKFYEEQEVCHICKKEFCYDKNEKNKFKLYQKVRDHSKYDYHLIIKELAEQFKD